MKLVYNFVSPSCLSLVLELLLLWFISIYPEIYLLSTICYIFLKEILMILKVIASRTRNGFHPVLQRYYEIFLSSLLILLMKTGYYIVPIFFYLKFNLYFSTFCLTVINFNLQFWLDEFREKFQLANLQYSFLSVMMKLFLERCLIGVAWCLPAIFWIISQIAFGLVEEFSLLTYFCQHSFFFAFITLRDLALFSLYSIRLGVVGSFWNLFRAALRNLIAFRHSLSKQGLLRLLVVEFLGTHSFAISIYVSLKCSIISWFVSIWVNLFLHSSLNIYQLALSNFQRVFFPAGFWALDQDWEVITTTSVIIHIPSKVHISCGGRINLDQWLSDFR